MVRIVVRVVVVAVGLVILAIGVFVALDRFWPSLLWGAPPEMATGLAFDKPDLATAQFDAVLRQRFAAGTPEAPLRAELLAEGFKYYEPPLCVGHEGQTIHEGGGFVECPGADSRSLHYEWGRGMFCSNQLIVTWSADAQKRLVAIDSAYYYVCI
jgi:hypothetical protein